MKGESVMPRLNVKIQNNVIQWALNQTSEEKLGIDLFKNVKQWIAGTKIPTFNQIEEFSKKTNIPLGYLFLQTPPIEKIDLLEYRTIDSIELANPSRDLIDTIFEMERIQDWMKEYRQESGFDFLTIVGSQKNKEDVKLISEAIRNDLDLEIDWYKNTKTNSDAFAYIREKLNEVGVIVMQNGVVGKNTHRPLNIEEFRAFAMVDEWAPLIFINSIDSQRAKLFSLFHEIAHIWLGENDLYNDRRNINIVKRIEVLCNSVASELLVPANEFIQKWKELEVEDIKTKINLMTQMFKCSESVIARKALDYKKIDKSLYIQIIDEGIEAYKSFRESDSGGGNYYNTLRTKLDGGFVRALCESVTSGRTTYTEAYRLTNTTRKTFPEIAMRFGGVV